MMERHDLDRLAELIARELIARAERQTPLDSPAESPPGEAVHDASDARPSVRPHRGRARPGLPPVWNQPISAISPPPDSQIAAREAASRRGVQALESISPRRLRPLEVDPRARQVPIGVASHYLLLSDHDWRALYGSMAPSVERPLRQPGQVAYREAVRVVGPAGELARVRVLGPFRARSRLAVSRADAHRLGLDPPTRLPGDFGGAASATAVGPAGSCTVPVVVAAAHLHLDPSRAALLGLAHGQRVGVRCAGAGRAITLHDVPAFVGPEHAPELHVDVEEANAAGVRDGDAAFIVDPAAATGAGAGLRARRSSRPLLTERDVDAVAARGEWLSPHSPYLITPAARDRARYLGIWRER